MLLQEPSPGDTNRERVRSVTSQPFFFLNDHWGLWFRGDGIASHKCITSQTFTLMGSRVTLSPGQSPLESSVEVCAQCDPMDCSSVHGTFQARMLELFAILFSFSRSVFVINVGIGCISKLCTTTGYAIVMVKNSAGELSCFTFISYLCQACDPRQTIQPFQSSVSLPVKQGYY